MECLKVGERARGRRGEPSATTSSTRRAGSPPHQTCSSNHAQRGESCAIRAAIKAIFPSSATTEDACEIIFLASEMTFLMIETTSIAFKTIFLMIEMIFLAFEVTFLMIEMTFHAFKMTFLMI